MGHGMRINNKDVFVVESHQEVLQYWEEYHTRTRIVPTLFTLDHHTDCSRAFQLYATRRSCEENQCDTTQYFTQIFD